MIYLVSFGMFLLFVFFMSLSYLFKGVTLKTEEEATAEIMGSCQLCSKLCELAGKQNAKPKKELCDLSEVQIPHQNV